MNRFILALACVGLITCGGAGAIDQLDGFPQPQGLHWNYYPHYFTADKVHDHDGHMAFDGAGISLYEMLVRPVYIKGDWLYNMIVPVGVFSQRVLECDYGDGDGYDYDRGRDSLDDMGPTRAESSSGVGDIILGAGKFQKVGDWHWLPYVAVKLATGPYDQSDSVNYGTGQTDASFENYFNHCGRWSFDGLVKYTHRFKNHDTGYKPGDELRLEMILSYGCGEMMGFWHKDMWGLCVEYMTSTKAESGGMKIDNSKITKLSVGPEVYHGITERSHFWFGIKYDVIAENAPRGTLYWIKYTLF